MRPLRVLVVDDEPGMCSGVGRVLADTRVPIPELEFEVGFAVEAVGSGEEALRCLDESPPDLLLLDHKLPGISGLGVLAELAERDLDLLVVMVTAYASLEMAVRATKQGTFDLLAKPFRPDELRAVVGKAARHLLLQRRARELVAERRAVRFELLSLLAHELKAPLAAVESYLWLLREPDELPEDTSVAQLAERCHARVSGMRTLIHDLLDLTRIEAGTRHRVLEEVDLAALCRSAVETVEPAAAPRGIALHGPRPDPVWLMADRSELEMVCTNLLSNAVKYNRPGGRVDVSIEDRGGEIELAVRDTGFGLTPEEQGRLFGEFVRIRRPETEGVPGSGLGLSIVSKVVAQYRGEVTVRSAPGVGSTFTVRLPREG